MMKFPIRLVLFLLLLLCTALLAAAVPGQAQSDERCFEETGYCITGPIRQFWEQNGGLPVFGYPITPQEIETVEGQPIPTQWFERSRLEIHPEGVMMGRLGVERLEQQGRNWRTFQSTKPTAECRFFEETGHAICLPFLHAWRSNGLMLDDNKEVSLAESLALYGYPLSGVVEEQLSDGRTYRVQWFERARLELHTDAETSYVLSGLLGTELRQSQQAFDETCRQPLVISDMKLKDHTLFAYQGFYYLSTIQIDRNLQKEVLKNDRGEFSFGYARTQDLCTWEELEPALTAERNEEEEFIWAPHVIEEVGTFYMFYTRVNPNIAQSIALATSTNPADPQSWQKHGIVFQPNHAGMIYPWPDKWADARDPMILREGEQYLMYYTGRDESGGIIGLATAPTLVGPWTDHGATHKDEKGIAPESPFVLKRGETYYLFYNQGGRRGQGPHWRWSDSPTGPWHDPVSLPIGWAHDFYFNGTDWLVSYVIGDAEAIGVAPLAWDDTTTPPTPQIPLVTLP